MLVLVLVTDGRSIRPQPRVGHSDGEGARFRRIELAMAIETGWIAYHR